MECRISMITLGVADVVRARRFYEAGLGWKAGSNSSGEVVFFQAGGLVLGLYRRDALAQDALWTGPPYDGSFPAMALAHNVREKPQVAQVIGQAQKAGATVLKSAQDTFWGGHAGYFADPDGHIWEIAWNPHFKLTAEGAVVLPG